MRTTPAIDDDGLFAAKELASMQRRTLDEVVSELVRSALRPAPQERKVRNGVLLLPVQPGSPRVTSELVKHLDEELP